MKNKLLFAGLTRDQIAAKLLDIADKKLLVRRTVYKYKNNQFFSTIFNKDEVESELLFTVTATLNALEKYNASKTLIMEKEEVIKKLTKLEQEKINKALNCFNQSQSDSADKDQLEKDANKLFSKAIQEKFQKVLKRPVSLSQVNDMWSATVGDLDLDSEGFLTGYLITAFTNNIRKIYGKHQTDKRTFKEMVYSDSYSDETEDSSYMKNKLEAYTAVEPIKEKEYKQTLVEMAKYLRNYDKRQNQVNQNQKSQLTKLFCAIVNPRKVENNEELRNRFGWSQYLLNKNREIMEEKIREEFLDSQEDIISYLDIREKKNRAS